MPISVTKKIVRALLASGFGAGIVTAIKGTAATGTGTGTGVTITGGTSGTGATGNGGTVVTTGGAAASTNGAGGAVSLVGGAGAGTGAGGAVAVTGGASGAGATGNGAAITITGGAALSTAGNGGHVNLVGGAKTTTGTAGEVRIAGDGGLVAVTYAPSGTPSATDVAFFVAPRAYRVKAISQVHSVAAGGASKLQVTKDTSTDAPGAGTDILTNNTNTGFDLNATANTVQAGTLSATVATLELAAGDRLSVDYANSIQSTAGVVVTVLLQPI